MSSIYFNPRKYIHVFHIWRKTIYCLLHAKTNDTFKNKNRETVPYVTLEHKTSLKSLGCIYRNSQKYIVWVKIIDFPFMPKIIRILRSCSMKIYCTFPTVNISKLNFWLVICIAKNFIWTTLKMIFSIFRFFCTLRLQIFKYCPIITNHTLM